MRSVPSLVTCTVRLYRLLTVSTNERAGNGYVKFLMITCSAPAPEFCRSHDYVLPFWLGSCELLRVKGGGSFSETNIVIPNVDWDGNLYIFHWIPSDVRNKLNVSLRILHLTGVVGVRDFKIWGWGNHGAGRLIPGVIYIKCKGGRWGFQT